MAEIPSGISRRLHHPRGLYGYANNTMKIQDGHIYYSPSDLANHLACTHLTDLERQYAAGEIELVYHSDSMLELLVELGKRHEEAYLAHLNTTGKSVDDGAYGSSEEDLDRTIRSMKRGTEVIFQASLSDLPWRGRADFLLRVEEPSALGNWSYQVADTKLALETRATTVLQLCMYSEMVAKIQGVVPSYMHIVKPGNPFETESLRTADFAAYYRLAKQRFLQHVALPIDMNRSPEPCARCEICNWWPKCNQFWRDGDHLFFVAGMPKSQIVDLREHSVNTLEAFARLPSAHPAQPKRGSVAAYGKSQRQAKIQLKGRLSGKPEHEFNQVEHSKGFCLLPEPNEGDVFFDIEGNPRAAGEGLEYLLGFVTREQGTSEFTGLWGLSKAEEKKQFETFVDLMLERWSKYPSMHIYHFAPYEPAALKRLALRHATREDELDRLLRSQRFVDLYAVTRQGIRASVESYSIKQLEQFYGFERAEELESARKSLREVERLIEFGLTHALTNQHRSVVELYNKDDCLSTLALREWLETLRSSLLANGAEISRPTEKSGDASDGQTELSAETKEIFDALVADIGEAPLGESQSARWLLAHMLDYFRRENKCRWWEYYRLRDLDHDELLTEKSAIAGLTFQDACPLEGRARTPVHRYSFPSQETTVRAGVTLYDDGEKPWGTVHAIDVDAGWIDVKKTAASINRHATAAFAFDSLPLKPLPESLRFLGSELAATGTARSARYDLLARNSPRLKSLTMPLKANAEEAAVSLALDLDSSILPIQGPPGAGKTTIGSHMIAALSKAGKKVGVTAVSHKVILNLLQAVIENSGSGNVVMAAHQLGSSEIDDYPTSVRKSSNKDESHSLLRAGHVVGGTAWLWASDHMEQQLDYLFIDEAGQMSLAMALAAGRAARNIVLLGDPQQLEQPQQGSHPEGSGIAALAHLLNGRNTIPEDRGLFLPRTWRLHPAICQYTSELYYDSRLQSETGLENQTIVGPGAPRESGLHFIAVEHSGNQNRSDEEIAVIGQLVQGLTNTTHYWFDSRGRQHKLELADILIVAPFNAQVNAIRQKLPGVNVGTVDKFQGQEAPIVIYSMTCSSAEDAPRGMSFLYSPNRMNVASSRAKCLAIVVASPRLLEPACTSPEHIRLANGLCRFAELADSVPQV